MNEHKPDPSSFKKEDEMSEDELNHPSIVGRPALYTDPDELQEAIDGYFKGGMKVRKVVIGKKGQEKTIMLPVPTITGLVLFLGFDSRQSFYDYEKKPEFSYTIKRARTFIEQEYEEILQTTGSPGAIFALKNFGWVDRTEQVITGDFDLTLEKVAKQLDGINDDEKPADGNDLSDDDSATEDEDTIED